MERSSRSVINTTTACPPSQWWMLPELVGLNRLPAQATTYPYPDEESAAQHQRESSPWYLPLDGRWRFRLMPNPWHDGNGAKCSGMPFQ